MLMMLQRLFIFFITLSAILLTANLAAAHCEVPCGIYDDQLRADLIAEHAATVEKSMKKIRELSSANPVNYNQLVRWVTNKDEHAAKIQHIVWQYFMTQRIKPDAEKYSQKVTVLHKMLIAAMKCKQSTDLGQVKTLRALLQEFEILYFGHSHR
jgi:nickel superoxide dismutase